MIKVLKLTSVVVVVSTLLVTSGCSTATKSLQVAVERVCDLSLNN